VRRRIVRPLGLTGTHVPGTETTLPTPHARNYSTLAVPGAEPYDVTEMNASCGWAAGGMVSSLGDLTRFLAALLDGRLLPAAQQEQMFTEAPGSNYGLGIVRWPLPDGTSLWGHNGMIHGSFTIVAPRGRLADAQRLADGPWDDRGVEGRSHRGRSHGRREG
jgi:D-alanyl-D-alanine carboxypeptidase